MKIAMIGTGYVGLVSATCFAEFGLDVVCVDKDQTKIENLRDRGIIPIYEPGLEQLVASNASANRLTFTTDLGAAVREADAVFIAVGTPTRKEDGNADLSYVFAAAREIAASLDGYTVVVTKSTVPVGTGRVLDRLIREANPNADFDMVSNPEFLREGSAIGDFMQPDRVVVGVSSDRARAVMARIYRIIALMGRPVLYTSIESSEMIKYAANAFLATKITFINEIAELCEQIGANVLDVSRGMGLDQRIGTSFLNPGPGYGGSCFPKDTLALTKTAQESETPLRLVETVVEVNARRKRAMADKIARAMGGDVRGRTIAILGLTFKPETDDMRDSPSLEIIPALQAMGAHIRAYDPQGMGEARKHMPDITYGADISACVDKADAAVIITDWAEFRHLDLDDLKQRLARPLLIDLRNLYDPEDLKARGFTYVSVGRADARPHT